MPEVHEKEKEPTIMATVTEKEPEEATNPEPPGGLIREDGSINWDCPCLGGMATGPCGAQFREAFACFHYSTAAPKGSNCVEAFTRMQDCMQGYPELYGMNDEDEEQNKNEKETDSTSTASENQKEESMTKIQINEKDEDKNEKETDSTSTASENKKEEPSENVGTLEKK